MICRAKAPFRLGLAGGGTDVSPYSDLYGGAILNATVDLFAHAHLESIDTAEVIFHSPDTGIQCVFPAGEMIPYGHGCDLQAGVYNRFLKEGILNRNGLRLTSYLDVPSGSGLGTSSTLMVAIIKCFCEYFTLPLGDYEIAHLAYEVERKDLALAGGKQDQYAATFGGFNYMEFYDNDRVIVNPLRIKTEYKYELENNLVLYYTSSSRESAKIISEQQRNVEQNNQTSIEAMHSLKVQSKLMKEALLVGKLDQIGEILDYGFSQKMKMASSISNSYIDEIYATAKKFGATGGKISGAGGGGFMFFYCPKLTRYDVIKGLSQYKGKVVPFHFYDRGAQSWKVP